MKKYSKMGKKKSKKSVFSDSKTSTTMMISALDRTAEINLDVFSEVYRNFYLFLRIKQNKNFSQIGQKPKLAQTPVKNCWVKKSQKETPIRLTF